MKVTTNLRYRDGRHEGQVLHQGTTEECERVATAISAISVSGEIPVETGLNFLPDDFPVDVGQRWRLTEGRLFVATK